MKGHFGVVQGEFGVVQVNRKGCVEDTKAKDVNLGDYIIKIDGEALSPTDNIYEKLQVGAVTSYLI